MAGQVADRALGDKLDYIDAIGQAIAHLQRAIGNVTDAKIGQIDIADGLECAAAWEMMAKRVSGESA